jgi:hypothetical protein
MTAVQTLPMTNRDDVRPLAWDLARASGTLDEIATTWRRAWHDMPQLPLGLPLRLQDDARQLEAAVRRLADDGHGWEPGQAELPARQLSALRAQAAAARSITCGPGSHGIGDELLWESLSAALDEAAARLAAAPLPSST